MKDIDIYGPADKAIQILNRDIIRSFGKLKMAKFDEIHLIREVTELYREQAKKAKRRYYEMAFEAFLLAMYLCEVDGKEAQAKAEKAITKDWVEELMEETNFITLYRFNTETERKAQRLTETLAATADLQQGTSGGGGKPPVAFTTPGEEIDRAIRAWSKQVGQYAISVTDEAVIAAYEEAGIPTGIWASEKDSRVCSECRKLDGKKFKLTEIPVKPHWGCRCKVIPNRD